LAATGALALGLGVGGFGGVALPTGDMADEDHGDMETSPKFGGKFLLEPIPLLELEAAVAYHTGHHFKDWTDVAGVEEPSTKVVPITFGANVKYQSDVLGVYVGGGFGYYLSTVGISGATVVPIIGAVSWSSDTNVNSFGLYWSGGVLLRFGRVAVDINPRYNYLLNDGTYDVTYNWSWGGFTGSGTDTYEKDWKDTYVDIIVGVNYYFL
jgi:hypothetical protein